MLDANNQRFDDQNVAKFFAEKISLHNFLLSGGGKVRNKLSILAKLLVAKVQFNL